MTKHIPNLITLLNLLSGSIAVIFAVNNDLISAAIFVCIGTFFDFFDGLLARKLNVQSELGLQLDSLADMVTSGLVPGLVMYQLLNDAVQNLNIEILLNNPLPLCGLCITLASAYRLAKFNIDTNQTDVFIGLPTPANALLILSLPLILKYQNSESVSALLTNQWALIGITTLSCYLLNANIKLIALKFKTWSFQDNIYRYILIIFTIIFLILFKFIAIPFIILFYFIISLLKA